MDNAEMAVNRDRHAHAIAAAVAEAIAIHKAQGMSMDGGIIDL